MQLAGEELEEQERRHVGGLEIVDDEHDWPIVTGPDQKSGHRVEQLEPGCFGISERRGGEFREHLPQLRDDLGDTGRTRTELAPQRRLVQVSDVPTEGLDPRPVGRRSARLPATAPQHRRAPFVRRVAELVGQPALTDARFTAQQEQPPPPAHGVGEATQQVRHLPLAAHESTVARGRVLGLGRLVGPIPHGITPF